MRTNPFESQLERLARTLTEQFGVAVVCQGDQAYTDGKTIVLPSLPEPLEEDLERMMVGYLDHEMAHVAFSDFKQVKRFNKKYRGFEAMLNVVEDALIEKLAMERWPGVRANLDALFRQVRNRVLNIIQQAGPFRLFCTAVYLKLSHHTDMLGLDAELQGYEDLLDRYPQVATTRDSARLAEQLLKRWLQRRPKQPALPTPPPTTEEPPSPSPESGGNAASASNEFAPPKPAQDSDTDADCDGDKAEDSENETDGGDKSPEHGDTPSAEESESAGPSGNEMESDDENSTPSEGEPSTPTEQAEPASSPALTDEPELDPAEIGALTEGARGSLISDAVMESIAETIAEIDTSQQYRPFTRKHDRIDVVETASDQAVQELLTRNVDSVRRLRRGLANALRAAKKRWWHEDQTRGDLSPKTLHRLGMDQACLRIFRKRASVQGKSTAVSIVLDASGSMTIQKMDVARDAMRVLLDALHDLKIPTEAFTFTTGDKLDVNKVAAEVGMLPHEAFRRFTRFSNLEIGLIKRFEEPVKIALKRLPSIQGTGLTPLGEAMEIGAARLIVRRESRKIMLVLTDGHAGCEGSGSAAQLHAKQASDRITQAGIELIGVGVQDQSLCAIVADTIVVNEISELPAQLCRLLSRTLKKGLRHVG
jgi:cobalamin biosynthesis protein CobT